jgi:hypothetical protein
VNLADEISTAAQAILNKQKVAFLQNEENPRYCWKIYI